MFIAYSYYCTAQVHLWLDHVISQRYLNITNGQGEAQAGSTQDAGEVGELDDYLEAAETLFLFADPPLRVSEGIMARDELRKARTTVLPSGSQEARNYDSLSLTSVSIVYATDLRSWSWFSPP
ncbi:hypothetical protein IAT40_006046 [Kwoniella sp. CBS 6097]